MTFDDFCKKHEPKHFADITFADDFVRMPLEQYALRQNFDNILLHGPFGSAKTTIAKAIMADRQRVLGSSYVHIYTHEAKKIGDLLPIEGDMNFQLTMPSPSDPEPYVIIEEVDMLSASLQKDLRSHINTFPIGKLILTTNDLRRVDSGLVSRCDAHPVLVPSAAQYLQRALAICAVEGVHEDPGLLLGVMQSSAAVGSTPSLRDMMRALYRRVNILKATASSSHMHTAFNMAAVLVPTAPPGIGMMNVSNVAPSFITLAAQTTNVPVSRIPQSSPTSGTP